MELTPEKEVPDHANSQTFVKKLWTIRLLLIGTGLIVLTFIIGSLWDTLGLTYEQTIYLALALMVAFGVNIAGFILGCIEYRKHPRKATIGLIGNSLLMLLFVLIIWYSLSLM